jgi:hypothetical protein
MLRPDPGQLSRFKEIHHNLLARNAEAEREGWLDSGDGQQRCLDHPPRRSNRRSRASYPAAASPGAPSRLFWPAGPGPGPVSRWSSVDLGVLAVEISSGS